MWYPFFYECSYMAELVVAGLIFIVPAAQKRTHFVWRLLVGVIACFLLPEVYELFMDRYVRVISNPFLQVFTKFIWYLFLVTVCCLFLYFCFDLEFKGTFGVYSCAFAAQNLVRELVDGLLLLHVFLDQAKSSLVFYVVVSIVGCGILYTIVYLVFRTVLADGVELFNPGGRRTWVLQLVMLLLLVVVSLLNRYGEMANYTSLNLNVMLAAVFYCVVMLIVQYLMFQNSKLNLEKRVTEILCSQAKAEYISFRANADYLETKIHDLKHELQSCMSDMPRSVSLQEVKDAVALHESFVKTGNDVLDIVLADKNLQCRKQQIALTCMVDGTHLCGMEDSDIYALFTNMIDNAIHSVCSVSEQEKRYIDLSVQSKGDMLFIHQENYCGTDLRFEDGLPVTTHKDKHSHGFGTRSMQYITTKYGGMVKFSAHDNVFLVDILIPDR